MGERKRSVLTLLINFGVIIALIPFSIDVFERAGAIIVGAQALRVNAWLYTVFAYLPILVLLIIAARGMLEPPEWFGLRFERKWLWRSVAIGVISAIAIFLVDLWQGLLKSFQVPPSPTFMVALGFVVALGVLEPFTEEFLFRGVIQSMLQERIKSAWRVHPAVFLASGFEVLMHLITPLFFTPAGQVGNALLQTLPQLGYVALFGGIGGYIYQRTKSLTGPLLIHALGNVGELFLFWGFH